MAPDLFLGQQLKLDRAHEHIGAIDERVQRTIDSEPYRVTYKFNHKNEAGISVEHPRTRIVEHALLEAGVLIGDVIHNLRSALDETIWVLGEELNPGAAKPAGITWKEAFRNIRFPIVGEGEEAQWATAVGRNLWRLPAPEVLIPILKGFQPLDSGRGIGIAVASQAIHDALNCLDALWVMDKHKTIPVVLTRVRFVSGLDELPRRFRPKIVGTWSGAYEAGTELLRFSFANGIRHEEVRAEMNMHFRYAFEIAFDEAVPWLEGRTSQEALTTLHQFTEGVFRQIVDAVDIHGLAPERDLVPRRLRPLI